MENQTIREQVFDVLFNYVKRADGIYTESDCATVRDEICLRIDQSQFTADEAEELINQEVEKRIMECWSQSYRERNQPMLYGWICLRCGAVHSPYSTECHCLPPVRIWTGTSAELTEGGGE